MDGPWLNDLTARDNRYKFNVIERIQDNGLNMDLAPFRSYDPAIGRWWQADPLAALAPEQSPYRFGFNSPMNFGDPLGLFETREEAKEYKREHRTGGRVRQLDDGTYAIVNKKSGGFLTKSAEYGVTSGVLAKRGSNVATISPYNPTLWDRAAESDNFFISVGYSVADSYNMLLQSFNPLDTRVEHLGHGEVTQNEKQALSLDLAFAVAPGIGTTAKVGTTSARVISASKPLSLTAINGVNQGFLPKAGGYVVYRAIEKGKVVYVGMTKDFGARAAKHLKDKGIVIKALLNNLSYDEARLVEQALIEKHGLNNLMNKINGIAKSNPRYQNIQKGYDLLKSVGY